MGIPMNPESIEQDLAYSNAYDDPGFTEATFAFKPQPPLPDAVQRTTGPPTSPDGRSTGSTREEQLAESNHIKGQPWRRLAAIPLRYEPSQIPAPEVDSSLPMLGAASVGLLCAGYMLRRRCRQAKERRDSFGFLPDWRRSSLNACELNA